MTTSNNANVTINVTADESLVVTVAGKEYSFDRNKAKVGMALHGEDFPFPIFENIKREMIKNRWVGSYVTQEFDGKQAAIIMAGPRAEMELGNTAATWFTQDVNAVEAKVAQDATLVNEDQHVAVYEANGKKFVFDKNICQSGAFIRPESLGVVLPAAIEFALSKPARMAQYKYQDNTLMIEVYEAPRLWGLGSDGIWIIENVDAINPSTATVE